MDLPRNLPPSRRPSPGRVVGRDAVAEATHRAVCEFSGTDGFGQCYLYTVAGLMALERAGFDMANHQPHGGSLTLFPDPGSPLDGFRLDPVDNGWIRGEYHTFILARTPEPTVIDFSSRHYRRYLSDFLRASGTSTVTPGAVVMTLDNATPRLRWKRPAPPSYLWTPWSLVPDWVRFGVDVPTTEALRERHHEETQSGELARLKDLVQGHYERLVTAA